MNLTSKNVFTCLFFRPWLGVPLGIWVAVSIVYYWWLISRIDVLETENKVIKKQLSLSGNSEVLDSATRYTVPEGGRMTIEAYTNKIFTYVKSWLKSYSAIIVTYTQDRMSIYGFSFAYETSARIPDAVGTLCETVHIALVCMGKCTRNITPMLKSLLHHRQNPIHFHFIVGFGSMHTINTLFETWDLPDVKYTCYDAQDRLSEVKWIPNSHYSGVYALVKLLFPSVLPDTLDQVLVLDSDLTFLSDVAELWHMFRNMSSAQFIGLVENESNWYTNQKTRWPALNRGYNTGVMLLDLHKIRTRTDWTRMWQRTVKENIDRLKVTTLADQDIINAIIKKNAHIVYDISCQYNVQMSTQTLAKYCYGEDIRNVKILHWNSPRKYNIRLRDTDHFKNLHQSYVNYDGILLREKLHRCSQNEVITYKMNHSDLCLSFRAAQRVKLRTHIYYMDYSYVNIDNFDVTLVLQLSMDRLQFLERLVKYWEGPLSAAIYLSDCEVTKLESFIKDWSSALSTRNNIGYHLVFKHDSVHYPVNYLRNVALENVNTPYVFVMDADFVPMAGLYEHLRNSIKLINPYPQKKVVQFIKCLVVPAFETQRYRASPPRYKEELLARLAPQRGGDVAPFRAREWPRGHRATNYSRWTTATAPYEVDWQSDYEPYLVVHRTVPKYDTRFSGFGWNKVSHSVELRAQGYGLLVLPAAFVLHTPHAPSPDITAFRADPHYRVCLALLKREFMDDLRRKYNVTLEDNPREKIVD